MADSIFDLLSNVTLFLCNRAAKKGNTAQYPVGMAATKHRQYLFLLDHDSRQPHPHRLLLPETQRGGKSAFHLPSVIAVTTAFVVKLTLFLYCFDLRNKYSQARIPWEDHRNDLLINGFGILTSVDGSTIKW
ncbi:hypothetical protein BDW67DRAFT_186058 [Aspergillus spinulosporus]